jgi:hypothetical protein
MPQHPFMTWAEAPAFRDWSAYHHRRTAASQIAPEAQADWEHHNQQVKLRGGVPMPPLWAYRPHKRLLERSFLLHQIDPIGSATSNQHP